MGKRKKKKEPELFDVYADANPSLKVPSLNCTDAQVFSIADDPDDELECEFLSILANIAARNPVKQFQDDTTTPVLAAVPGRSPWADVEDSDASEEAAEASSDLGQVGDASPNLGTQSGHPKPDGFAATDDPGRGRSEPVVAAAVAAESLKGEASASDPDSPGSADGPQFVRTQCGPLQSDVVQDGFPQTLGTQCGPLPLVADSPQTPRTQCGPLPQGHLALQTDGYPQSSGTPCGPLPLAVSPQTSRTQHGPLPFVDHVGHGCASSPRMRTQCGPLPSDGFAATDDPGRGRSEPVVAAAAAAESLQGEALASDPDSPGSALSPQILRTQCGPLQTVVVQVGVPQTLGTQCGPMPHVADSPQSSRTQCGPLPQGPFALQAGDLQVGFPQTFGTPCGPLPPVDASPQTSRTQCGPLPGKTAVAATSFGRSGSLGTSPRGGAAQKDGAEPSQIDPASPPLHTHHGFYHYAKHILPDVYGSPDDDASYFGYDDGDLDAYDTDFKDFHDLEVVQTHVQHAPRTHVQQAPRAGSPTRLKDSSSSASLPQCEVKTSNDPLVSFRACQAQHAPLDTHTEAEDTHAQYAPRGITDITALESLDGFERFGRNLEPSPLKDMLLAFFPKQRALLQRSAEIAAASSNTRLCFGPSAAQLAAETSACSRHDKDQSHG